MTLQGVFFYDAVGLIILCDFIPFIMYIPIILWFLARVSDAHAKKQIFFFCGVLFYAIRLLEDRRSYETFVSVIWNSSSSVCNINLVCNLPEKNVPGKKYKGNLDWDKI